PHGIRYAVLNRGLCTVPQNHTPSCLCHIISPWLYLIVRSIMELGGEYWHGKKLKECLPNSAQSSAPQHIYYMQDCDMIQA
ncbi:hypothetical protein M378DRAFT_167747, partial [Amanita muscaria Koide BX008]